MARAEPRGRRRVVAEWEFCGGTARGGTLAVAIRQGYAKEFCKACVKRTLHRNNGKTLSVDFDLYPWN